MEFVVIGVNYQEAPQDVRDQVSFTDQGKMDLCEAFAGEGIQQAMVLSTCNRSEVYFFVEQGRENLGIEVYLSWFSQLNLREYVRIRQGRDAYTYLYEVACGMKSMVLGEDQILGQVQEALSFSQAMGYSGKELNHTVREAITCAKRIKTEFKSSEIPLSMSYIGIQKLNRECKIEGRAVFIIGSGKMAMLALRYVFEYQPGEVYLCSRSMEHARRCQTEFPSLRICAYERRYACMSGCDLVISATSAPHLVVRQEEFFHEGEIWLLDLASPRDVDKRIAKEPLAHLYDIDALRQMAEENRRQREKLLEEGRTLMIQAVEKNMDWIQESRMDATIASLQQRSQEIARDGMEYLLRKLDLGEREKKVIERTLHACLKRFVREPILTVRKMKDESEQKEVQEVLKRLFQL